MAGSGDIMSHIYKKGRKVQPMTFLPVCLLSHTRKKIDTAMLVRIQEYFALAKSQL